MQALVFRFLNLFSSWDSRAEWSLRRALRKFPTISLIRLINEGDSGNLLRNSWIEKRAWSENLPNNVWIRACPLALSPVDGYKTKSTFFDRFNQFIFAWDNDWLDWNWVREYVMHELRLRPGVCGYSWTSELTGKCAHHSITYSDGTTDEYDIKVPA